MDKETWLTGTEAQNYFNIITEDESSVAACLDGLDKEHIPESLKAKLNNGMEKIDTNSQLERAKLELKLKLGGLK